MATTTATRRLAAILAADVVGYSRLMGADEEGTHERVKAHLVELIDPKIGEHHGRIVKTTGDGVLAEFASVVDAVRCAAEVQRGMLDREADLPDERRIRFRIGINLGDVIAENNDIFGDGINVAARLEALAEPGGICVSRTVRDQIRNRLPYMLDDRGEHNVKNIALPVRVYALRPETIADLPASSVPIAAPRRRRSQLRQQRRLQRQRWSSPPARGGCGRHRNPRRRREWQPPRRSHNRSQRRVCRLSYCRSRICRGTRTISPTASPTI
jgi:adenylate cyclase